MELDSENQKDLGFCHFDPKEFDPANFAQNELLEEIRNNPDRLDVQSKKYFDETNYKLFPKKQS